MHAAGVPAPGAKPAEDNEDAANAAPDVETRIVTLDRGDTLAGAMEDVGVSSADANSVIAALGKDFDPRALKAGMNFELTYSVAPVIEWPTSSAAKSGTPWKTADQFSSTCAEPPNPRPGWTGCALR